MRAPIGFRIRNQRKLLNISQAGLARLIGISPSYLNLIEASKRDVGGILLQKIAENLNLKLEQLSGEGEQRIISDLEEVFIDPIMSGLELRKNEGREFVAQFPKMAMLLTRLYRSYVDANEDIENYSNRLKADPLFSELLHQVLSQITAIRSSAEILGTTSDLSETEQKQFSDSISLESSQLSQVTQNLIGHFDQSSKNHRSITPTRELDNLIIDEKNYFATLEDRAKTIRSEIKGNESFSEKSIIHQLKNKFDIIVKIRGDNISSNVYTQYKFNKKTNTMYFSNAIQKATRKFQLVRLYAELSSADLLTALSNDKRLTSPIAQKMAFRSLARYLAGAVIFPYSKFLSDAKKNAYDVDFLRQKYKASFEQVAHRLVTLREKGNEGIPFAFLRSDPAGRLTKHFPLPGLLLPNSGHACPLWAIYKAFQTNSQIVRQVVRFSDGSRYLFVAKTVTKRKTRFKEQQLFSSVMLACDISYANEIVYSNGLDLNEKNDIKVGPSCRLCVLKSCAHRQEEALYPISE